MFSKAQIHKRNWLTWESGVFSGDLKLNVFAFQGYQFKMFFFPLSSLLFLCHQFRFFIIVKSCISEGPKKVKQKGGKII